MITPAFAQSAAATGASGSIITQMAPLLFIFVIMYFFILRPQQRRMKEHQSLVNSVRRGDLVVTNGGLLGKVTKVTEGTPEIEVEIAEGVKVKILRSAISEVRNRSEPAKT